jgi:DNA-binding LytR/AlgR family response regulator
MKILLIDDNPILEIHSIKGDRLISINEILYIKAQDKGSIIHLLDNDFIETRYLLNLFCNVLPTPYYFRCHKSYIINCIFVDCHTYSEVILKENERIPFQR